MIVKCYDCFQDYDSGSGVCPHCGFAAVSDHREPNHLPAGTLLQDRYLIGKVCGFGGFGVTYKAYDRQLEHTVAIKEYFPNGAVNRVPGTEQVVLFTGSRLKEYQYGLERFLDEARMTARYVSHKNIVNVFDYFEANKTAYIVMEYLDGIDLAGFLETATNGTEKLSADQATDIALNVCNALKTIHADGIIHRDISPDNIYLCLNDSIKVYDFGAARFSATQDHLLTVILKPGYAPVEQYVGQDEKLGSQGPWTDIYALGATMYKMVTGVKPEESMNRKIKDELKEPIELEPSVPQYLNDAIMRAMAVEPHLRFQTVEELEAVLKQEKKVVTVKETIRRKKRMRALGIAGAAAAVVIGAGCVLAGFLRQHSNNTLKPASFQVWYRSGSEAEKALEEIRTEFCSNYPDVTIELLAIQPESYKSQLAEADAYGNLPALFQSDGIDTSLLTAVASVEPVLKHTDLPHYLYSEDAAAQMRLQNKVAAGFELPVFYLNTADNSFAGKEIAQLGEVLGTDGKAAASDAQRALFPQFDPEGRYPAEPAAQFYEGKADILLAGIAAFPEVRSALPGQYKLLRASGAKGTYINCWSLGTSDVPAEEKAAQRFLEYLLSDNAQDFFYIRHMSAGLPVNRTALDVYREVYQNDMSEILADPDSLQIELE